MQANLCLRTAGPNAVNKHHPLPFCQASSVLLRRHCQLALNFSPLSCNGLWAGPSRRLTNMAVHSHVTHQEDGFDKNKAGEPRRAISKLAAAAVVLACTLGAMCTSLNSKACTFPFFSPPQVTGDPTSTPTQARPRAPNPMQEYTIQEKSIQALREIFDRKCNTDSQKPAPTPKILLEILKNALPGDDPRKSELKKYLDQLDNIEKSEAATNSLFKEWEKRQEKRQYNEAYNMGLVLIDLLINQGDYKRAHYVCEEIIKIYVMESDVRLQIRRAILDMLLLADAMGSEVKETEKGRMLKRKTESTMLKFIKLIQRGLGPPQP